jgi:hypothetical protein
MASTSFSKTGRTPGRSLSRIERAFHFSFPSFYRRAREAGIGIKATIASTTTSTHQSKHGHDKDKVIRFFSGTHASGHLDLFAIPAASMLGRDAGTT